MASSTAPNQVVDLTGDDDDEPVPLVAVARRFPVSPSRSRRSSSDCGPDVVIVERVDLSTRKAATKKRRRVVPSSTPRSIARKPDPPDSISPVMFVRKKAASPLFRIYELFPDIKPEFATDLFKKQAESLEGTIQALLELDSYPKIDSLDDSKTRTLFSTQAAPCVEPKHDYFSASSFVPSGAYSKEATDQLLWEFPFLLHRTIKHFLPLGQFHYAITRERIIEACLGSLKGDKDTDENDELRFDVLQKVWDGYPLSKEQIKRLGGPGCIRKGSAAKGRRKKPPPITVPVLQDEVAYIQRRKKEWIEHHCQRIDRQNKRRWAQSAGTALDCPCCFESVHRDELIYCRYKAHSVCSECVVRYAKNLIYSNGGLGVDKETKKPNMELKCFHASNCSSGFYERDLQKAFPKQLWSKYNEMAVFASAEVAGLSNQLSSCPKCGCQAEIPEMQMIFECPIPSCKYLSCKNCGRAPHIPLRCEEVERQQAQDKGRLHVEEAISKAKIRSCPKCKRPYIKSDGCNKMACPCGVYTCYICRAVLDKKAPYTHFCRTPHCNHKKCGHCQLYTNDKEDDARAMREAGIAAAKEHAAQGVNIDVEKLLR